MSIVALKVLPTASDTGVTLKVQLSLKVCTQSIHSQYSYDKDSWVNLLCDLIRFLQEISYRNYLT